MFGITLISEVVNDRSLVAMAEDVWTLPFLVAIYTLPAKPNQWLFFVSSHPRRCTLSYLFAGSREWTSVVSVSRRSYLEFQSLIINYSPQIYTSHPGRLVFPKLGRRSKSYCECFAVQYVRWTHCSLVSMLIMKSRFVQASSIVAAQIYRKDDAPRCLFCWSTYFYAGLTFLPIQTFGVIET